MTHPENAAEFLKDSQKAKWHDETLWFVRDKRDKVSKGIPEWEQLRELASGIKNNVLANLADYLEEFERNATKNGIIVHWAADSEEHNRLVLEILQQQNCTAVVKSKSILTEECHLNPYLEKHGVDVVDTDLGERIVQFLNQPPATLSCQQSTSKKERFPNFFTRSCTLKKAMKIRLTSRRLPEFTCGRNSLLPKWPLLGSILE